MVLKSNICLIGLAKSYTKNVAKHLSEKLGMYFGDLEDLMQFDLIDIESAKNICGADYINKVEESKMKMLSSFENTLFTLNYDLLNLEKNLKIVKSKSIVIFLLLNKKNATNKLKRAGVKNNDLLLQLDMLETRSKLCEKIADLVIDCNDLTMNKVLSKIKKSLYDEFVKD